MTKNAIPAPPQFRRPCLPDERNALPGGSTDRSSNKSLRSSDDSRFYFLSAFPGKSKTLSNALLSTLCLVFPIGNVDQKGNRQVLKTYPKRTLSWPNRFRWSRVNHERRCSRDFVSFCRLSIPVRNSIITTFDNVCTGYLHSNSLNWITKLRQKLCK